MFVGVYFRGLPETEMFVDTCEFVVGFNDFSCLFMSFAVH